MKKKFSIGFSGESSYQFIDEEAQMRRTYGTTNATRRQKSGDRPPALTEFLTPSESRSMR